MSFEWGVLILQQSGDNPLSMISLNQAHPPIVAVFAEAPHSDLKLALEFVGLDFTANGDLAFQDRRRYLHLGHSVQCAYYPSAIQ